jgi:hypothetical protein
MIITGSPDISVLQLSVVWDISGLNPVINISNLSQGPNLAGVTWWFSVYSPSGTPIHEGSFSSPDQIGAWSSFSLTDRWPMPFNQIEWSGAPYTLIVGIQDSVGNQYQDSSYSASIKRPNGNTSTSKNFYGVGATNVQVMCQQAIIYFEDISSTSYYGITGTRQSSTTEGYIPSRSDIYSSSSIYSRLLKSSASSYFVFSKELSVSCDISLPVPARHIRLCKYPIPEFTIIRCAL